MQRTALFVALVATTACDATLRPADDGALDALQRGVTCDPTMHVFPVGDAHNIGYDHASCGSGTCDISCPDANANSDWGGAHHGIDIFAYQGAPLVAVTDAEVVAVGTVSATSGLRVRLRDACGWEYYYGHMDTAVVSVGDQVSAGELIGTMGYTGTQSTHLHFNVSPDGDYYDDIDPIDLLVATSATACGAAPVPHDEDEPCDDPVSEPPVSTAPSEPAPTGCGVFEGTTILEENQSLVSCDQRFDLVMQGDGNLVLYQAGWALWNTETHGHHGAWAAFQDDGNLVVYSAWNTPLWSSGTHGHPGAALAVQDDGNVVIYDGWTALWSTGTQGL
jgi:hypothetical protein